MSQGQTALTYSELPTITQWSACEPPFSFYFDLIKSHWKAAYTPISLHRLCTLARKQGASFAIVESVHGRADIVEELSDLDKACGEGGAAEAVKITFIKGENPGHDIASVRDADVIGQAVLVNYKRPRDAAFTCSYMFEALFRPPTVNGSTGSEIKLLNNYYSSDKEFPIKVLDREFKIRAAYYCQQNSITHACAQACLRMALNTMQDSAKYISSGAINNHLNPVSAGNGLTLGQIGQYITDSGLGQPLILDCSGMDADQYLSVLDAQVQSGMPTLLIFSTATQPNQPAVEHVVSVVGSTHNSDEWHPQAIPAYAGPSSASYRKSSLWTDHFIIHDDNFGPYYTLSARALEVDKNVVARYIIGISPVQIALSPNYAEAIAAIALNAILPSLRAMGGNPWLEYISSNNYQFVLRPVLIKRENYLSHLQSEIAHDGSKIDKDEAAKIKDLPDYFWMIEFSMPSLFTGNHSKLGEVLISPAAPNANNVLLSVCHIRLPGYLFSVDAAGQGSFQPFSMTSHIKHFLFKPIENRW